MEILLFIIGIILLIRQIVLADKIHRLQYRVKLLEEKKPAPQTAAPAATKQKETTPSPTTQSVCAAAAPQTPKEAPAPTPSQTPLPQTVSLSGANITPAKSSLPPVTSAPKAAAAKPLMDWEKFTTAQLFSWIGGFTLFLGIAFGIKYSIDNSLLSPAMRVAGGALCGMGLLAAGLLIRKENLRTTSHTLCGCGLAVLYACIFGAYAFYHLIGQTAAFLLMAAVAAASFAAAVWKNAKYIAFLAEVISFLTPFLLSDSEVRPLFFFTYVAFVLAASAASALKRKWNGVLIAAAVFAAVSQSAYVLSLTGIRLDLFDAIDVPGLLDKLDRGFRKFSLSQTLTFCSFSALYCAAAAFTVWKRKNILTNSAKAVLSGFVAFDLLFVLLAFIGPGSRLPVSIVWMGLALWLNILLAFLAYQDKALHAPAFHIGKILVFLSLLVWTNVGGKTPHSLWMLCSFLAFAAVNAGADLLAYKKKASLPGAWTALFPVLLMTPLLFQMFQSTTAFLAASAVLAALFTLSAFFCILIKKTPLALAGGGVFMLALLIAVPSTAHTTETIFPLLLGFLPSLILFTAARRILPQEADKTGATVAICSLMPYLLLLSAIAHTPGTEHMSLFLLFTLLTVGLNLFFAFIYRNGKPILGALAGATLIQLIYATSGPAESCRTLIFWVLGFFALFALYPFIFKKRFFHDLFAWAAAALSGVTVVICLYVVLCQYYTVTHPGLLSLGFALLYGAGIYNVLYWQDVHEGIQRARLAWLAGTALFFVTLIFPLELGKAWLTTAWALEGAALVWLNRKLLHRGLTRVGFALLATAFVRLVLNPCILNYYEVTHPVFNWYLYAFGISATTMLLAAEWWQPADERAWRGWLRGLGGVTLFVLLNIEIASYFSFGGDLSFDIFGAFNSAIAYTVGWTAFGAVCLVLGIHGTKSLCARTGMTLILLALLKLFLSDIWALSGLYRIGGLIGIAVLLILISFVYQRTKQNR